MPRGQGQDYAQRPSYSQWRSEMYTSEMPILIEPPSYPKDNESAKALFIYRYSQTTLQDGIKGEESEHLIKIGLGEEALLKRLSLPTRAQLLRYESLYELAPQKMQENMRVQLNLWREQVQENDGQKITGPKYISKRCEHIFGVEVRGDVRRLEAIKTAELKARDKERFSS